MSKPLEPRIAAALNADGIASDELGELIAEAQAAAEAADADAAKTREQALDPAVTIDVAKVAAAVAAAELVRDRLRAALPRLRERYKEVQLQENVAAWNAKAKELTERRNAMVTAFAEMLPVELIGRIAEQLISMRDFDRKIADHNWRKPDDDSARFIPDATPAFAEELRLPDMTKPRGYFLWPPSTTPAAALAFPVDPFVGAHAADGTYAREHDRRMLEAEKRRIEEAERRAREFEAMQGGDQPE